MRFKILTLLMSTFCISCSQVNFENPAEAALQKSMVEQRHLELSEVSSMGMVEQATMGGELIISGAVGSAPVMDVAEDSMGVHRLATGFIAILSAF